MVFISRSRIPIFACVSNSIGPKIRGLKHFNVEVQGFEVISRRFLFVIKLKYIGEHISTKRWSSKAKYILNSSMWVSLAKKLEGKNRVTVFLQCFIRK